MAEQRKRRPKTQATMLPKYRNWNAQRRMQEAVRLVTGEDKLSQSEAARMCGVSRSRLNEHIRAWREKQAELERRSAEARAERNVKPVLPGEERPAEEPAPRPYEAVNETRRVPPLVEFNELYFSGLPCSDCGDMVHETPEFHKEMMRMMDDPAIKRLLINLPPYHAKVLALTTPIPTPTGWTTIGELEVGDEVFDKDGKVCRVKAISPLKLCRRRVVLGDGSEFITDDDHRWWVQAKSRGRPPEGFFTTTAEVATLKNPREYRVPLAGPLDLPEVELPVDPYVLGLWLGDGDSQGGRITTHVDDQPHVMSELRAAGYEPWATEDRVNVPGLLADLRAAGVLGNKHVPEIYLRASAGQRLALLQGLMDSDGTVNVRAQNVSFTNTNERLSDAVFELVASLGWKPRRWKGDAKLDGVVTGVYHEVAFSPVRHRSPFRMGRKTAKLPEERRQSKVANRPFRSVEDLVEPELGVCIAVDSPTETFLAGRAMVPTGNSTVGTLRATLYDIVKDPNSRTAVITKSQNLAKKFIYQITRFLSEPDMYRHSPRNLIEDWGPFFDGDARQTTQFLYTAGRTSGDKEPTVEAFGIGSQIYGNRWTVARLDDAFDMQNSRNPQMVEFYVDWITGEVESRVGKSGKVYIIGTRVGPQDAYSFLQKLEGYHVVRYPAIIDEAEGITLWQDHFDIDAARLKRASMKPDKWQLLYQNADTLGADASFTLEMLENVRNNGRFLGQYDPGWAGVIGLDPAGGNKQSGYTALTLLAVDLKTGKRYLVDVVNQLQMKAPQLRDQLFTWADQYQGMVRELRVESNGLQSQLVQYNEEILAKMTSRGIRVVPHITHGGKGQGGKWDPEFGIESMAPMFYNRQIDLPYADINARRKVGELEEQLMQFPLGQVTDVMMSLWFAELGCRDLFRRAQMPLFDPNFKLPRRLRGRRRVVDFASKSVRSPSQEEVEGLPSTYGSSLYPVQRPRFVNMPGEV